MTSVRLKESDLSPLQLYGMDAAGETAWCELLPATDRETLRAVAAERLSRWHAVEIWEGPVCLVRLRRPAADER